jgi:hypothetical protein
VLNGGVSASWMNDEGLLANGVSATEEAKQLLDGIVSSMMEGERNEGLLIKVFQQQKGSSKQVLGGVVSVMKIMEKWREWKE